MESDARPAGQATGTPQEKPVVLITGVGGLIGSRIVQRIKSRFTIVGIDLNAPEDPKPHVDWIGADLTDDAAVRTALDQIRERHGSRLASVIHLAAYYDFAGEPSPLYRDLTVEGTRRLLQALQHFTVEQFIFSSSLLVMQPATDDSGPLTESSPLLAKWDYPQSKIEAEEVIRDERGNIPAVILRISGVYDEDCRSIPLAQQITRIYERQFESRFFPGSSDRGQAFVHLEDLAECFERVIDHRDSLSSEEVFLIAEPDVVTYAELQDQIGEALHGREWPTIRIPKVIAKAGAWVQNKLAGEDEQQFIKPWMIDMADDHYPVDISHARTALGWEPRRRLRDTIGEMARRLKQSPRRWYEINGLPVPDKLPT